MELIWKGTGGQYESSSAPAGLEGGIKGHHSTWILQPPSDHVDGWWTSWQLSRLWRLYTEIGKFIAGLPHQCRTARCRWCAPSLHSLRTRQPSPLVPRPPFPALNLGVCCSQAGTVLPQQLLHERAIFAAAQWPDQAVPVPVRTGNIGMYGWMEGWIALPSECRGWSGVCHGAQHTARSPEVRCKGKTRRGGEKDGGGRRGEARRGGRGAGVGAGAGAGGRRSQSPGLPALQERRRGAEGSEGRRAGAGCLSEDGEQLCRQHCEKSPFAYYKLKCLVTS